MQDIGGQHFPNTQLTFTNHVSKSTLKVKHFSLKKMLYNKYCGTQ
jgi:hypothetical protein